MYRSLVFLLLIQNSIVFASDFKSRGFIVLDLMNIQKIEGQSQSAEMGYGTADIKFYFNLGKFSTKLKLDIDGKAQESGDLMEEALVNYRLNKKLKFTFGKGKVRFHQMHHGITERNYTDGGSVLGTKHGFRDQDRRYLLTLKNGSRVDKFVQYITIFGYSQELDRDRDDDSLPYLKFPDSTISYSNEKTFNTKNQKGAALKLEFSPTSDTTLTAAGLYYWRDIDPHADWAVDLALHHNTDDFEIWFEAIYAYLSKHPNDSYTSLSEYDNLFQLGFLYKIRDNLAVGINTEVAIVRTKHHDSSDYPSTYGQSLYNDGQTSKTETAKIDVGLQYRPASRVQISTGIVAEKQHIYDSGTSKTDRFGYMKDLGYKTAYSLNAGLSFWF